MTSKNTVYHRSLHYCAIASIITLLSLTQACEDFVQVEPPANQISQQGAFANESTAIATTLNMYGSMCDLNSFAATGSPRSMTTLTAFSSDEFDNYSSANTEFAANDLSISNPRVLGLWSSAYSLIYTTNLVIEGVNDSPGLSSETKNQLEGEARFMRAFCYFYLVNLFGDVPLVTSTDYTVNSTAERTALSIVYDHIVNDLTLAAELMRAEYLDGKNKPVNGRFRPSKFVALAFLARVYLYKGDLEKAESLASAVIENPLFTLETSLDQVFLSESKEAIWQLNHSSPSTNSIEGIYFIRLATPSNQAISAHLMDAFEEGDERKSAWIGSYSSGGQTYFFPYKYKVRNNPGKTEHSVIMRLAEVYLIRAEARAKQNKLAGAEADLNAVRNRAGLEDIAATSVEQFIEVILKERQTELFSEWGHRWFDLKRSGRVNDVLSGIKTGWTTDDALYPIPENEIINNPSLLPQNPGY